MLRQLYVRLVKRPEGFVFDDSGLFLDDGFIVFLILVRFLV